MENKLNVKHILLMIVAFWIASNSCKAQSTYQKYDSVTRGAEYHICKAQIESNIKIVQLINNSKKTYSIFDKNDSISKSRSQAVISAKENENFRLNQKAFLLMDANKIEDTSRYNSQLSKFRPTLQQNSR